MGTILDVSGAQGTRSGIWLLKAYIIRSFLLINEAKPKLPQGKLVYIHFYIMRQKLT